MEEETNLDHVIVSVNDIQATISFWQMVFGFESEGTTGPFTILRISRNLTFQFAPWGTKGGAHYAFSMSKDKFEAAFSRLKGKGIEFGDSFHAVGNQKGPGIEAGSRGLGKSVYFFDPNKHLLEIRTYENS